MHLQLAITMLRLTGNAADNHPYVTVSLGVVFAGAVVIVREDVGVLRPIVKAFGFTPRGIVKGDLISPRF